MGARSTHARDCRKPEPYWTTSRRKARKAERPLSEKGRGKKFLSPDMLGKKHPPGNGPNLCHRDNRHRAKATLNAAFGENSHRMPPRAPRQTLRQPYPIARSTLPSPPMKVSYCAGQQSESRLGPCHSRRRLGPAGSKPLCRRPPLHLGLGDGQTRQSDWRRVGVKVARGQSVEGTRGGPRVPPPRPFGLQRCDSRQNNASYISGARRKEANRPAEVFEFHASSRQSQRDPSHREKPEASSCVQHS